jgi:hypothetical protein
MEGILYGSVLPFIPALCFAPRAACNYFSTSVIYFWSCATWGVSGCVEVSLSYSVIASSSSIRSCNFFVICSWAVSYASSCCSGCGGAVDLVVLWDEMASALTRSSYLVILSTRSPITDSRCRILDSCALLTVS